MNSFKNKVTLTAGRTTKVGRAIALAFVREGQESSPPAVAKRKAGSHEHEKAAEAMVNNGRIRMLRPEFGLSSWDAESGIKIYLRQSGQVPLLTPQEEIELAARINKGDQEARTHMIMANLRLVVKIARAYAGLGLPLLDLISEGNIGLMKAVERFDPKKGAKLSTYAALWIKQSIRRSLSNQSRTIRLPANILDEIAKMNKVAMQMTQQLGREPTDEELAQQMDLPASKISRFKLIASRPASLDASLGDGESAEFGEMVADEAAFMPYDILGDKILYNQIRGMLTTLDQREATIINRRYGLDGREPQTLEQVGAKFKITRERVRQIQNIALTKLRRLLEKHERMQPENPVGPAGQKTACRGQLRRLRYY